MEFGHKFNYTSLLLHLLLWLEAIKQNKFCIYFPRFPRLGWSKRSFTAIATKIIRFQNFTNDKQWVVELWNIGTIVLHESTIYTQLEVFCNSQNNCGLLIVRINWQGEIPYSPFLKVLVSAFGEKMLSFLCFCIGNKHLPRRKILSLNSIVIFTIRDLSVTFWTFTSYFISPSKGQLMTDFTICGNAEL